jgi:signal peptidase I
MKKFAILHLSLERDWFDEIAQGTKRIEYRKYKPYWTTRLEGRKYDVVKFRNGYGRNVPEMLVEYRGLTRANRSPNADYVIKLGRVLELKRWQAKE